MSRSNSSSNISELSNTLKNETINIITNDESYIIDNRTINNNLSELENYKSKENNEDYFSYLDIEDDQKDKNVKKILKIKEDSFIDIDKKTKNKY